MKIPRTEISEWVGHLLKDKHLTISTMESCTGGGILHELVKTSGASAYVKGGLVTYTNAMKIAIGKIPAELIATYSELSEECAYSMAENARRLLQTDIGIGITGLLESDGECFAYIGISNSTETKVERLPLNGNRLDNLDSCIFTALNSVGEQLLVVED